MTVKLYPKFEEVFVDDTLKGIFYPLCTVELPSGKSVHFVSHNGLWTDYESNSDQNTEEYYRFTLCEGKYAFSGDITIYKGYKVAKAIQCALEEEFWNNEDFYFKTKLSLADYTTRVMPLVADLADDDLDLDSYIEFFYAYSFNKLVFLKTGQFGRYKQLIDGFSKATPSQYVYQEGDEDFDDTMSIQYFDEMLPDTLSFTNYNAIGMTIGYQFFADGNDCVLYYSESEEAVICFNSYS